MLLGFISSNIVSFFLYILYLLNITRIHRLVGSRNWSTNAKRQASFWGLWSIYPHLAISMVNVGIFLPYIEFLGIEDIYFYLSRYDCTELSRYYIYFTYIWEDVFN